MQYAFYDPPPEDDDEFWIELVIKLKKEIKRLRYEMTRIADVSERWPDSLVSQINEIARAALKGEK
jgi:hypothetical protein